MAINIDGDGLIALGGTASTQGRVRLAEDTDNGTNFIELTAPASVGSDRVITFPDATTTVVGTDTTQTLTNKTIQGGAITSGTAVASTSGTSIDFTGTPAYVKRITVMFKDVSLTGSDALLIQIGDSGGVETTSYASSVAFTGTSAEGNNRTDGYVVTLGGAATRTYSGAVTIVNISGNTWIAVGNMIYESTTPISFVIISTGIKTLSATLDRVRVTRTGTNTFDAGSINILFE